MIFNFVSMTTMSSFSFFFFMDSACSWSAPPDLAKVMRLLTTVDIPPEVLPWAAGRRKWMLKYDAEFVCSHEMPNLKNTPCATKPIPATFITYYAKL